jgi:hypothetical protein
MFKLLLLLPVAAASCVPPSCTVPPDTGPAPKPVCDTTYGYLEEGRLVVTVLRTEDVPCDLLPGMQANLVWNAETEGPDWGSDASVQRAEREAADAGCSRVYNDGTNSTWYNDGDYRLVGTDCDF